ncbi:hypothetical protein Nepgr_029862 [Nepenthes gracilis]|uniref:SBP-type domain-containing protein n=1 Tax=Nepenthes gracilis TaxID=150966 RepID=A0AAD3Y5I2_NEPGR|nr:hypothetical protein Nepgr_029862 [Nepenthes gracilis]
MEQTQNFYGIGSSNLRAMGKRSLEWDLNDWKWDGDLFIANPLNPMPLNFEGQQFIPVPENGNSSNSSLSCSDDLHSERKKRELERKRRVVVDDESLDDEAGTLTLKLGGYPMADREVGNMEGTNGKKTKLSGSSSSRAVCQVDDCGVDLSSAKDYHRRHKVCEMHSKASKALVGNAMQRFCQQCSRFHVLQEFDEGKRSCRRRLAGHNKRRRKTQPDAAVGLRPINDEQTGGYILIGLLRMLSSMHANNSSDQTTNQDLITHLLRSLGNQSGPQGGKGISRMLHESQKLLNGGTRTGNSDMMSSFLSCASQVPPRPTGQHLTVLTSELPAEGIPVANYKVGNVQAASTEKLSVSLPKDRNPAYSEARDSTIGRAKLNNFDLNDTYVDSSDGVEDLYMSPVAGNFGTVSIDCPSWAHQDSQLSSPPNVSGNSESVSTQSPSSSSGEAQIRTDRIVFKLFGKEPNEFPSALRGQILDWLTHSPTDIESYIRPGCIILTIYLRLSESIWEELCSGLGSKLAQLSDISNGTFWRTGWVYSRVQHQIAFIYNGQVVTNTSVPTDYSNSGRIYNVIPIAVSISKQVKFCIRGSNLSRPTVRLLCALEGKYLVQEVGQELKQDADSLLETEGIECVNFSCPISAVTGRGFIEVEDHGLSSSFFPFIVAEKDVCSEIRMLEAVLELTYTDEYACRGNGNTEAKRQAMDFIHEMGWLLHRNQLKSRLGHLDPNTDVFSFKRFKWLMEYSLDRDWCAVVKKLLDIMLEGTVGFEEHPSSKVALSEMGLLHRAVCRNCKPLVELLLRYEHTPDSNEGHEKFLFRPDATGPAGLTPLHVASGRDGSDNVLNALTDDPGKVGIEAWKNARDSMGLTPEDYARMRGHYSYVHLVQKKMNRRSFVGSVLLDIPDCVDDASVSSKQIGTESFEIGMSAASSTQRNCKLCDKTVAYGNGSRSLVYRPAMLSMVAIAAVCVCVALLFKSLPEVVYVFQPFRWELLEYGSS